jgi:hypothetical protein
MNLLEFERLCVDASLDLGVEDPTALGRGLGMQFANVLFRTSFRGGHASFLLTAELGCVPVKCRAKVYEHLLTAQLMTWDRPGLRFGFNPGRNAVVLCAEIEAGDRVDAVRLAIFVRSIAAQAVEWRDTLLTGNIEAPDAGSINHWVDLWRDAPELAPRATLT